MRVAAQYFQEAYPVAYDTYRKILNTLFQNNYDANLHVSNNVSIQHAKEAHPVTNGVAVDGVVDEELGGGIVDGE